MSNLKYRTSRGFLGIMALDAGALTAASAYLLTTKGIPEMYKEIGSLDNLEGIVRATKTVFALGADIAIIGTTLGLASIGAYCLYRAAVPKKKK